MASICDVEVEEEEEEEEDEEMVVVVVLAAITDSFNRRNNTRESDPSTPCVTVFSANLGEESRKESTPLAALVLSCGRLFTNALA
jgi:hypothetical protein